MQISQEVAEFLIDSTAKERSAFFHPKTICVQTPEEHQEQWVKRFLIWQKFHFLESFEWDFGQLQYDICNLLWKSMFTQDQIDLYTVITGRDQCKTLFYKHFLIYTHLYGYAWFDFYLFDSQDRIHTEFADIRAKIQLPTFVRDYGNIIHSSTKSSITFMPLPEDEIEVEPGCFDAKSPVLGFTYDPESAELEGVEYEDPPGSMLMGGTIDTFRRGITHGGHKPERVAFDDIETRATLASPADTNRHWRLIQTDIFASLLTKRNRRFSLSNYLSTFGIVERLKSATKPENLVLVGLYKDAEDKYLSWSERFAHTDAEALESEPRKISVETIKREMMKLGKGLSEFREEYLCRPLGDEELYHNVPLILSHCPPKEEYTKWEDGILTYNIYKPLDPNMLYCAGVDLAENIGLDSSAVVLIAYNASTAEVVADAFLNLGMSQTEFCASNIRFFNFYGVQPFVAPEANMGGAYIAALSSNYPKNLIFKRENVGVQGLVEKKTSATATEVYGIHANRATNVNLLSGNLRTALHTGQLLNHSPNLHAEITYFTNPQQLEMRKAARFEDMSTQHFDILSAARYAWHGLEQASASIQRQMTKKSLREQGFYDRPRNERRR